jgi:hypothetical protein
MIHGNVYESKFPSTKSDCGIGAARFFFVQHTKRVEILMKYTKGSQNILNGSKIDQMDIKFTNISHCKTLQNLPKLGFLDEKICHLATLCGITNVSVYTSYSHKKSST